MKEYRKGRQFTLIYASISSVFLYLIQGWNNQIFNHLIITVSCFSTYDLKSHSLEQTSYLLFTICLVCKKEKDTVLTSYTEKAFPVRAHRC